MFSRCDRDALVEPINRYLAEDLTAFKLDDALCEIAARTKDETVKHVAHLLWYHYDDVKDHKVVASKAEWDLFQRLLLILKSDTEIVMEKGDRKWTVRQLVAVVCLVVFGCVVMKTGFGYHLFWATVPLGGVSVLLSLWRSKTKEPRLREQSALVPFGSVSEIFSLRRRVRSFVKSRYPARLGLRRIRGPVSEATMSFQSVLVWVLFSPVALVFQALPEQEERWKVVSS